MKSAATILLVCLMACTSQLSAQVGPAPPNQQEIKARLDWIVGKWESKTADDLPHRFECEWVLDKQFIRGKVMMGDPLEERIRVFIGWNPVAKKLTVSGFTSNGAQTAGEEIKSNGKETHFAAKGVEPEGPHSLTLIYALTDDGKLIVEYRNWMIGGTKMAPLKIEFERK